MLVEGAAGVRAGGGVFFRPSLSISPLPFRAPSLAFPLQTQRPQEKHHKAGEGASIYLLTKSRIHFDEGGEHQWLRTTLII